MYIHTLGIRFAGRYLITENYNYTDWLFISAKPYP